MDQGKSATPTPESGLGADDLELVIERSAALARTICQEEMQALWKRVMERLNQEPDRDASTTVKLVDMRTDLEAT